MKRMITCSSALAMALLLTGLAAQGRAAPAVGDGAMAAPRAATVAPAPAAPSPTEAGVAPAAPAKAKGGAEARGGAEGKGGAEAKGGADAMGGVTIAADDEDGEGGGSAWPTRSDSRRRWAHSDGHPPDPPAVAVIVPVAFFLFVLGLVAVILVISFRKTRLRHETLRLIVERGGEIPAELLAGPPKRPSSDLRKGVILVACGVGIGLFLALVAGGSGNDRHAWSMGFIPALIGLGYLLVWRLERRGVAQGHGPNGRLAEGHGPNGRLAEGAHLDPSAPRGPLGPRITPAPGSDTVQTGRDDAE